MQRPPQQEHDDYRPTSRRQRLLILTAAVAMAVGVLVVVLQPHVGFLRADKARQAQDAPACSGAQTQGCVGGTMGVITAVPAAASAPR